jgi:uncharacterized protein YbjT (DUF2867 family)
LGVAHPAPSKEREFRAIDLASLRASVAAARKARVAHFIYVSVAQPAPVMKAYQRVRKECERILADSGIPKTVLRPWYVLGPGHWWAVALKPFYALAEAIPQMRESGRRLGLVTLGQMVEALVWAVEHPTQKTRIIKVPQIRHPSDELPAQSNAPAQSNSNAAEV